MCCRAGVQQIPQCRTRFAFSAAAKALPFTRFGANSGSRLKARPSGAQLCHTKVEPRGEARARGAHLCRLEIRMHKQRVNARSAARARGAQPHLLVMAACDLGAMRLYALCASTIQRAWRHHAHQHLSINPLGASCVFMPSATGSSWPSPRHTRPRDRLLLRDSLNKLSRSEAEDAFCRRRHESIASWHRR